MIVKKGLGLNRPKGEDVSEYVQIKDKQYFQHHEKILH